MLAWEIPDMYLRQHGAVTDGIERPDLGGRGGKGLPWIVKCGLTGISQQNYIDYGIWRVQWVAA